MGEDVIDVDDRRIAIGGATSLVTQHHHRPKAWREAPAPGVEGDEVAAVRRGVEPAEERGHLGVGDELAGVGRRDRSGSGNEGRLLRAAGLLAESGQRPVGDDDLDRDGVTLTRDPTGDPLQGRVGHDR